MKSKLTKLMALTMAAALMCVPVYAEGEATTSDKTEGSISSEFGIYSPTLTVTVPLKANVEVNPLYSTETEDAGKLRSFSVASKDIMISNSSKDVDPDDEDAYIPLPVSVIAKATISKTGEDVVTHYYPSAFTASESSTAKEVNLNLTKGAVTLGTDKTKLDGATAVYATTGSGAKTTPLTAWGSQIQFKVDAPTITPATGAVTQLGAGAFAITGTANTNADWTKDDINVSITYNIKASKYDGAPAGTVTPVSVAKGADAVFKLVKADLADSKVISVGLHNNSDGAYGDYIIPAEDWKVEICETAGTPSGAAIGDAIITVDKSNVGLGNLADNFAGKAQDFVIVTEDGRFITTTLTVTKTS